MLEHKTLGYFLQNVGCLCPFFNSFSLCRPFPWHTSLGVLQAKVGPVPTVAGDSEGVDDLKTKFDDQRKMMPTDYYPTDLGELDEKVKSMMEKGHNTLPNRAGKVDVCKICGKEGQWVAIRDHIEANHLEGISLPCNICGKIFRSRLQLRKHRCVNDAQK